MYDYEKETVVTADHPDAAFYSELRKGGGWTNRRGRIPIEPFRENRQGDFRCRGAGEGSGEAAGGGQHTAGDE